MALSPPVYMPHPSMQALGGTSQAGAEGGTPAAHPSPTRADGFGSPVRVGDSPEGTAAVSISIGDAIHAAADGPLGESDGDEVMSRLPAAGEHGAGGRPWDPWAMATPRRGWRRKSYPSVGALVLGAAVVPASCHRQ